jgi:hypothetical protein
MSTFDSPALALEEWFDTPLHELPDALRKRVEQEFFPMAWDELSAEQRRSVALQLDYQHDHAMEKDRQTGGTSFSAWMPSRRRLPHGMRWPHLPPVNWR